MDCGSLTTRRSFERNNHRNLGDKGGERKAGKDFRRFTLRSGCAPHCWPCQLYTRPETQRRHLRGAAMDTRPWTHRREGEGRGMGIGKLSCRPKLDYGFAVYTHSHTWPHRIIPYSRLTADKIFSLVHPSFYVITSLRREPPSNFIFFFFFLSLSFFFTSTPFWPITSFERDISDTGLIPK